MQKIKSDMVAILIIFLLVINIYLHFFPVGSKFKCPEPEQQALIQSESENLVQNPFFSEGSLGWDMRPGAGPDERSLGFIDTIIYRTEPASLKIPPSEYACDTGECDRTVWQDYRIPINGGETIKLSGWVLHEGCCDYESDPSCVERSPCWVRDGARGDTEHGPHDCLGGIDDWSCPYVDRGGARLGMDFRDQEGNVFDFDMRIADWTMEPNQWHYLEMIYQAPEEAVSVIVWIQGFQYLAPASVWLDDVSLTILD